VTTDALCQPVVPPHPCGAAGEGGEDASEVVRWLRPEAELLEPLTLRSIPATRLSFSHSLVARMLDQRWGLTRVHAAVDETGSGLVVYRVEAEGVVFHFGAFSHPPGQVDRHGRIAEEEFDFFGALVDGEVDLGRLHREHDEFLTSAWRGRTDSRVYGWTVANRSNRLFEYVTSSLADGRQPDGRRLQAGGGYLVRNAGYYGNGRHGTRAWRSLPPEHPLSFPYHIDLLTLYLWRAVTVDIVEAAAAARSSSAVPLEVGIQRFLGIGNSSGIGTAAALVRWPAWLSAATYAREYVVAHATSRRGPRPEPEVARLRELLARAESFIRDQPPRQLAHLEQPVQIADALRRTAGLVQELAEDGTVGGVPPERPWAALADAAARDGSREALECLHALLIELFPGVADRMTRFIPPAMAVRRELEPEMTLGQLRAALAERFNWALEEDLASPGAREHFWYRSEENGENRRGSRSLDPGNDRENVVDVIESVQQLDERTTGLSADSTIGEFLMEHPALATAVSRVQLAARLPYTEVRANFLSADFLPSDVVRYFLSLLGAERPDPTSVQWVRAVFFQGAPLPADVACGAHQDWTYPGVPT
jgi:hypothetical protein